MVPHTTFVTLTASSPDLFLWSPTQNFNSWRHLRLTFSYGPPHKISFLDGIFTWPFPMVPHTKFQFLMTSSPDHFLWSLTQNFNSWWHLCQITSYGPLHKISIYDGIFAWSFPMVPLTTFQLFVAFRLVLNLWTLKQFLNSSWPFARFVKTDFT